MPNGKTTKDLITDSIASFDVVTSKSKTDNKDLYDLLDSLTTQIKTLNEQRNAVRVQIKAAESVEVVEARLAQKILEMLKDGKGHPALRRLGLDF